jgi:hypothetical protein
MATLPENHKPADQVQGPTHRTMILTGWYFQRGEDSATSFAGIPEVHLGWDASDQRP